MFSFAGYADFSGLYGIHCDGRKLADADAGVSDGLDDHGKTEVVLLFCGFDEFFVFGARHLFFLRVDVVWLGL